MCPPLFFAYSMQLLSELCDLEAAQAIGDVVAKMLSFAHQPDRMGQGFQAGVAPVITGQQSKRNVLGSGHSRKCIGKINAGQLINLTGGQNHIRAGANGNFKPLKR